MAPAFGATDPTSDKALNNARSKQISQPSHDGREGLPRRSNHDADYDQARQDSYQQDRQYSPTLNQRPRISKLSHTSPGRLRKSSERQRHTSHSTTASTTGSALHDAVRAQLDERDSIFATHYTQSPVTAPHIPRREGAQGEGRSKEEHYNSRKDQPTTNISTMAASPMRRSMEFAPALQYHYPQCLPDSVHNTPQQMHRPRPSRTSQHQRRSLYDFNDISCIIQTIPPSESPPHPDTPLQPERPSTPSSGMQAVDRAPRDLHQSAERQSYRSWRKGQAKMEGKSIAESQRSGNRRGSKEDMGVDKIIDAQLPQPEQSTQEKRSRKASHYLGLFRENEAEEKKEQDKRKAAKHKEADGKTHSWQSMQAKARQKSTRTDGVADDARARKDEEGDAVFGGHMSQKLPLGLLDEIRNHQHLQPGSAKQIPYSEHASTDDERLVRKRLREVVRSEDEDEDSDREHISSATYYPHQGLTVADSPTGSQLPEAQDEQELSEEPAVEDTESHDVQLSLQSEGTRDFLQGASRGQSSVDFKALPKPAITDDGRASDSEYESDAYGYDSTVSGKDEDEEDLTPTATPRLQAQDSLPPQRRHSVEAPDPVGAVELKPYKHQVGGHSAVYRFSRRAVCKQLNSKENMFYETVEKHHPDLLGFMPRYIGVLNVTYRKDKRNKPSDESKSSGDANGSAEMSRQNSDRLKAEGQQNAGAENGRMISKSMKTGGSVPQVIFENNRHLIPDSLFGRSPRHATTALHRAKSTPPNTESDDERSNGTINRPSLKPAASWGFTSVNEKLRDRVLQEVFAPPLIHKHNKRDRLHHARRKIPKYMESELNHSHRQNSVDLASLQHVDTPSPTHGAKLSRLEHVKSETDESISSDVEQQLRESKTHFSRSAESSKIPSAMTVPSKPSKSTNHRRRHSGGGLQRRPTGIRGSRGNLEFHENEDEAYTADVDDVFSMEDVKKELAASKFSTARDTPEAFACEGGQPASDGHPTNNLEPRLGPAIDFGGPEPRNPETSLVQHDERVERFLLLEDLTASMQKPCVLDLKMGTRQYGVEANEKKQASQRMKCKTTTSSKLGVRVCGMQVYNVREQKYNFEDKYTGRDLAAGEDFRMALQRFFFDGIGHAQALKHIPQVLDKLNSLEKIISRLPGYRLYASSLLMIYDRGDADENGKVEQKMNEDGKPAQYPDIKLKIVDFANCVTAEDMERVLTSKPCPPSHPEQVDNGYMRGLRSLRMYFQKIYKDLHSQKYVERGEGEGMAVDERGVSNATTERGWSNDAQDSGEVSS